MSYQPVFIVGCPRSGTTWVQLMLSLHPNTVTAPETQIFAYYLDHFHDQWRIEHEGPGREFQGKAGLSRVLDQDAFDELCRLNARFVLDRIHARDPAATHVIEKSPRHALHARRIHELFPDARFVHVIRDPRDTAASLIAAARSWGLGWAPHHPADAARMWVENVSGARAIADRSAYVETRYEDLKADDIGELGRILDALGLPSTEDERGKIVERCRLQRLQKHSDSLPVPGEAAPGGFFRKGRAGGWRDELSTSAVSMIEAVSSPLMDELGYAREASSLLGRSRLGVHAGLSRVREIIDWQLQRLLRRV